MITKLLPFHKQKQKLTKFYDFFEIKTKQCDAQFLLHNVCSKHYEVENKNCNVNSKHCDVWSKYHTV